MMQRRLTILVALLLLASAGVAVAQSSPNFALQRFVTLSGGDANSANFKVSVVIGQPATGVANSAGYTVTSGFLQPRPQAVRSDYKVMLPMVMRR